MARIKKNILCHRQVETCPPLFVGVNYPAVELASDVTDIQYEDELWAKFRNALLVQYGSNNHYVGCVLLFIEFNRLIDKAVGPLLSSLDYIMNACRFYSMYLNNKQEWDSMVNNLYRYANAHPADFNSLIDLYWTEKTRLCDTPTACQILQQLHGQEWYSFAK
jgi:hypothetical protein